MHSCSVRHIQAAKIQEDAGEKVLCVNYGTNRYLKAIPTVVTTFPLPSSRVTVYIFPPPPVNNPLAAQGLVLNSEYCDFTDNTKESEIAWLARFIRLLCFGDSRMKAKYVSIGGKW